MKHFCIIMVVAVVVAAVLKAHLVDLKKRGLDNKLQSMASKMGKMGNTLECCGVGKCCWLICCCCCC